MHIGTKSGAFRSEGNGDAGLVDEFLRQGAGDIGERDMDGDRHDGRGRRLDHHHRFRPMIPPAESQLAKELGMAGMLEAGAIEHILHDRGRDDGACPATLEGLRRPFN
jgi:hypothetical protein